MVEHERLRLRLLGRQPLMTTMFRQQAIWTEYLALRGEAYWKQEGHAITAAVGRHTTEPMTFLTDWNTAEAERPAA